MATKAGVGMSRHHNPIVAGREAASIMEKPRVRRVATHRPRLYDKALFLYRVLPANERKIESRRADSNR
jgi:hypothetical protein